jgi:gas vesicle protein
MKKTIGFLVGTFLGGIVGSGVVLLLAPGSGIETRTAINEKFLMLRSELAKSISEKRVVLESELKELKSQ